MPKGLLNRANDGVGLTGVASFSHRLLDMRPAHPIILAPRGDADAFALLPRVSGIAGPPHLSAGVILAKSAPLYSRTSGVAF
jgi:hypothetical protein